MRGFLCSFDSVMFFLFGRVACRLNRSILGFENSMVQICWPRSLHSSLTSTTWRSFDRMYQYGTGNSILLDVFLVKCTGMVPVRKQSTIRRYLRKGVIIDVLVFSVVFCDHLRALSSFFFNVVINQLDKLYIRKCPQKK
jgi:hypothetical protein